MWQDKACYVLYRHFRKSTDGTRPTGKPGKFPCVRTGLFFVNPLYLPSLCPKASPHAIVERQGLSDRQSVAAHGSELL